MNKGMNNNGMSKEVKEYILKGIVVLASLVVLLILVNLLYIHLSREFNDNYGNELEYERFLKSNFSEVQYIFFGTSHAIHGVNISMFNDSLDFARSGGRYVEDYYVLKKMTQSDVKIDRVVIEFDEHSFLSYDITESIIIKKLFAFTTFINTSEVKMICPQCGFPELVINRYLPVIGRGNELVDGMLDAIGVLHARSPSLNDWSQSTTKDQDGVIAWDRFDPQDRQPIGNTSLEYFLKILELAKENNISVVLIKYPVSPQYDAAIRNMSFDKHPFYDQLMQAVNQTLGDNYTLLDYQEIYYNQLDLLQDPHHLNDKGTWILSQKIYNDTHADSQLTQAAIANQTVQ